VHGNGVLRRSTFPSTAPAAVLDQAKALATKLATELNYVGVLALELFLTKDGQLVVNEFAPRVHNSGHWTIDGASVSQFEQHVRAIAGWPLAKPVRLGRVEMTNLIGAEADDVSSWLGLPGAAVHLYGKGAARPGRKMGHVTRVWPGK
jgi:5-(carboxyamino)imidazole ribonucleotide synthase